MSKDNGRRMSRTAGPTTIPPTQDPQPGPSRGANPAHPIPANTSASTRSRYKCPYCDRSFTTKSGLGVHKRRAHEAEVNEEVIVERVKRQWSDEELRLMAREEALATRRNIRFINQHLLGVVPERSLDAIKGARRSERYRQFVVASLEDLSESESNSSSYLSADSSGSPEALRRSSASGARVEPPSSYTDHRAAIEQLIPVVSCVQGWDAPGLVHIARRYLDGHPVGQCMEEWVRRVFPPAAPSQRQPRFRVVNPGRKLKRRIEYAHTQRMFRSKMSRTIKDILDGDRHEAAVPDVEIMSEHWGPFVSQPSRPVVSQDFPEPKRSLAFVWRPVSCVEVAHVTLPLNSAPGIDTITVRQWRAVPASIQALLFNTVLATGGFPPSMLVSRTVFIPKRCDNPTPADFRPISVMSVVVRHLHKIIAQRLGDSRLIDLRQRCFDDGCSENIAVLASVIMEARSKLREVHVASLDVAKAFDSVSHGAISAAMARTGIPMGLIDYVSRLYDHSYTVFEVRGKKSEPYKLGRGVRQGDPLSPILFCLVIDAVLGAVPPDVGFEMGGTLVNSLAFADDVLLISATKWGLQTMLNGVEGKARDQGLQFNPKKCSVLSIVPAGKQKKFKICSAPTFQLGNGEYIPQLETTAVWRYLGVDFQTSGPRKTQGDLRELLDNLTRAPLKPQQRLKALRCFLIPRLYHSLVLGRTSLGRLRALDLQIRAAVRRWLRLPHDTPTGFFHASTRDGGLGIPAFTTTVPGLMYQRFRRLAQSSSAAVRAVSGSTFVTRRVQWAERALDCEGAHLTSAHLRRRWWARRLHASVDGRELVECRNSILSSWWVDAGSLFIPGRDYVQYVHVRINCLPTLIRTSRGTRRMSQPSHCRAGCNVTETAAHIIQQCHRTHGGRVLRHNAVSKTLAAALRDAGWAVDEEPVFTTTEGKRKPDLVCQRDGEVSVVDAQIVSGATSLDASHERKCEYYGNNASLKLALSEKYSTDSVHFSSCTLSWRGIWASRSVDFLLHMGLTKGLLRGITTRVLQGSHTNWTRWNRMTTTILPERVLPRQGIG